MIVPSGIAVVIGDVPPIENGLQGQGPIASFASLAARRLLRADSPVARLWAGVAPAPQSAPFCQAMLGSGELLAIRGGPRCPAAWDVSHAIAADDTPAALSCPDAALDRHGGHPVRCRGDRHSCERERAVPKVIIDNQAKNFFDNVYKRSVTFKEVVSGALLGGDITYVLTNGDVSFYDHEKRIISIGVENDTVRVDSDIIFEMCNAYHEQLGSRKPMKDFEDAMKYAEATEASEWLSVKKHFEIVNELEKSDISFAPLNRFKPGFLRKEKPWTVFGNYLEDQKQSGHTEKIAKHHPNYGN